MLASVRVDVTELHVGLDQHHHLAGCEHELDRIRLAHDAGQPGRHAVGGRALQVLALLLRGAKRSSFA
jgi:hypothetical protein